MVNRRRGRDWVYKKSGLLLNQGLTANAELGVLDLVTATEISVMTTATLLRCILHIAWVTAAPWSQSAVEWYVTILNTADPSAGVYRQTADQDEYEQLFPGTGILEARDPLRIESNILLAGGTNFYGEPSDNVWALRSDIRVKRSLNNGDRVCLVLAQDEGFNNAGTVTMLINSITLVRAA